jgi:hypothetical protein
MSPRFPRSAEGPVRKGRGSPNETDDASAPLRGSLARPRGSRERLPSPAVSPSPSPRRLTTGAGDRTAVLY